MKFKAVNRGCRIASTGLKIKRKPGPTPSLPCVSGVTHAANAGTLSKILTRPHESGQQTEFFLLRKQARKSRTGGYLGNPRDHYRKISG
jgi:hypothetical protein